MNSSLGERESEQFGEVRQGGVFTLAAHRLTGLVVAQVVVAAVVVAAVVVVAVVAQEKREGHLREPSIRSQVCPEREVR